MPLLVLWWRPCRLLGMIEPYFIEHENVITGETKFDQSNTTSELQRQGENPKSLDYRSPRLIVRPMALIICHRG